MKKFFLICTIVLSSIIIQAQTTIVVPNVKISETERVIDKYLDKAGSVVGSVISKVTPIAKEAFVVYATKYHIQGFINISIALCLLILLSIITIFMFKRSTHTKRKKMKILNQHMV